MANAPDEKLVRRAQKGDKAAFAELFTQYEGRIFGYVYRMVGDRAWAEDLAQEAFIQAHQHLGKLGPPYDFKSWVYRIAGNLALDGLRRYRREAPLPDWDGGEATAPEPADQRREGAPEDQARLAEVRAAVWRTIHQLPESYRQVLILREIDGLAYNEIAGVLGVTLDNVRVTLHRARLQFRDLYGIQVMVEEGRMTCQGLDDLLSVYIDGELDRATHKRVKDHIKSCPTCQKKQRDLLAVGSLMAALAPIFPPLTLRQRFLTRLRQLPAPEPAPPTPNETSGQPPANGKGGGGSWPILLGIGGGGAILLVLAAIILGSLLIGPHLIDFSAPTSTAAPTATTIPAHAALPTQPTEPTQPTSTLISTSTHAHTSTPTPTHTPIPPTHTPTPPPPIDTPALYIEFWADAATVTAGACTTVHWKTANVQAVYFDGNGVAGDGSRQTCPCQDETHTLDVTLLDGSHDVRQITIHVTGTCVTPTPDRQGPPAPIPIAPTGGIVFSCQISVTLSWKGVNDPSGVSGYYVRLERRVSTATTKPAWQSVGQWGPTIETQLAVPVSCGLGYRWSVRARDGAGNLGPWSAWDQFGIGID